MTVSSPNNKIQYQGDGTSTGFAFPFPFFNVADLVVTLFNTAAQAPVVPAPVLGSSGSYDYIIQALQDPASGQYLGGGTVLFNNALPTNYQVTVLRVLASTQNISYADNSKFPAKSTESGLDRLTMITQQQAEQLGRALLSPVANPTVIDLTGRRLTNVAAAQVSSDGATLADVIGQVQGIGAGTAAPYIGTGVGAILRSMLSKIQEIEISVGDYLEPTDPDDTNAILKAYVEARRVGGKMVFPRRAGPYVCAGWDISGQATENIIVEGNDCLLVPASATQRAVITCDNSLVGFAGPAILFRNVYVTGSLVGSSTPGGDIPYAVYVNGGNPHWENSGFFNGQVASYFGYYCQYSEWYSCQFSGAVHSGSSIGLATDGGDTGSSSNELLLVNCWYSSNSNNGWFKGGLNIRMFGGHIQDQRSFMVGGVDQSTGALVLDVSSGGMAVTGLHAYSLYFEVNQTADVVNLLSEGFRLHDATFAAGLAPANIIKTSNCYDFGLIDCKAFTNMNCTITHPAGSGDTSSLTLRGNNFVPTLNLTHAGPGYISGSNAAVGVSYNQNMLQSCGGAKLGAFMASVIPGWGGVKGAIAKGVTTTLFELVMLGLTPAAKRITAFKLHLDLIDDSSATSNFGYGAHVGQTVDVFITCNNSGLPQVFLHNDQAGTDLGVNPGFEAPGVSTVTAAVSGNAVIFSINFPGAGTTGTPQASVFYRLEGVGNNSFYINPF
ncbi:MAG TPA: hypothetical protein VGV37_02470 [Aliidongia sp.]|uniref:hypothetical protein n=1 Tax=Aliidongia sp. TaxID=1914230 RepID=UPI002DDCA4DE|nr:hypothetical protein [Aliidongia sp.]HEV2673375.1 hypothetical protein [Aliidongia sp.]